MTTTRITAKGQITIPAEFRARAGFHPGDKVAVREEGDRLVIEPVDAWISRTYGKLHHLAEGRPPATLEEWDEAIAAGWAREGQ